MPVFVQVSTQIIAIYADLEAYPLVQILDDIKAPLCMVPPQTFSAQHKYQNNNTFATSKGRILSTYQNASPGRPDYCSGHDGCCI